MSSDKIYIDTMDTELFEDISQDIINIFSKNKKTFDKNECRHILNIIFESIFDEKLKNKNFNYIYNLINKNSKTFITKTELEPIIKALIVSFDVNYITNSNSFNDKVCIKIGKHLLPICYYIKKNND
jgi:uncharacterized membrane protein YheB (UPF0754 family)